MFVHSGFRTSSTWLWLKFRQVKQTRAYYEPFHEWFGSMSLEDASNFSPASWNSHHPQSEPYFTEYADLITKEGGISLYRPDMAISRYVPAAGVDGELSVDETKYLSFLIMEARRVGKRPVLCDTRSLARSRAIRKAFGGTHVLLTRNLHEQWCSFSEQDQCGNSYFFDSLFRHTAAGAHDPFLGSLKELDAARQGRVDTIEAYSLFLLSQLYANAVAFDACQIRVDINMIAESAVERTALEKRLSCLLHSRIELGDAKTHVSYNALEAPHRYPAEVLARQFLPRLEIPNASAECLHYVQRAFDEAFSRWDLSLYYSERTRAFFVRKLKAQNQLAQEQHEKLSSLEQQNKETQQQLERETAKAAHAEMISRGILRELHYVMHRPLWEKLLFRQSGEPRKTIGWILFEKNRKPRRLFAALIRDSNGQPARPFRQWMKCDGRETERDPDLPPDG